MNDSQTLELPPGLEWHDCSYYAVFDANDKELFRGSKTACRQFARKHKLTVSKVIMEALPQ